MNATTKQIDFYDTLLGKIGRDAESTDAARQRFAASSAAEASALITKALAWLTKNAPAYDSMYRPLRPAHFGTAVATAAPAVIVKDGRYAIITEGEVVKFYHVNTPDEGKWAGRAFVAVQASDDLHPVKGQAAAAVLRAIAADSDSLARYGKLLGRCGACGRTLTDAISRELGIGPVCREK